MRRKHELCRMMLSAFGSSLRPTWCLSGQRESRYKCCLAPLLLGRNGPISSPMVAPPEDTVSTVMYWIIWDLVDCIKDLDVPPPIQSRTGPWAVWSLVWKVSMSGKSGWPQDVSGAVQWNAWLLQLPQDCRCTIPASIRAASGFVAHSILLPYPVLCCSLARGDMSGMEN